MPSNRSATPRTASKITASSVSRPADRQTEEFYFGTNGEISPGIDTRTLCTNMQTENVTATLDLALRASGLG
jgi:hypothetical protein